MLAIGWPSKQKFFCTSAYPLIPNLANGASIRGHTQEETGKPLDYSPRFNNVFMIEKIVRENIHQVSCVCSEDDAHRIHLEQCDGMPAILAGVDDIFVMLLRAGIDRPMIGLVSVLIEPNATCKNAAVVRICRSSFGRVCSRSRRTKCGSRQVKACIAALTARTQNQDRKSRVRIVRRLVIVLFRSWRSAGGEHGRAGTSRCLSALESSQRFRGSRGLQCPAAPASPGMA